MDSATTLLAARRYLTDVLLNLPLSTRDNSVASFLGLLDHFIEHPEDYQSMKIDSYD